MANGRFVWFDLATRDAAAARRFYATLLGWEIDDSPGYHHIKNGGHTIGGMRVEEHAPPHWLGYVEVADVGATLEKIKSGDGHVVVPPTEIGTGRFAVFRDPQGAHGAIYQQTKGSGEPSDPMKPGNFCWSELQTKDPEAAARFYGNVFGWRAKKWDGPFPYWMLEGDNGTAGGLVGMPEGVPMPNWRHAIGVANVDASVDKARGLGAKVLHGPFDIPTIGRFTVIADPTGAVLNLFQGAQG